MVLTNCVECGLQVSDKAIFCPHCGYVFRPESTKSRLYKKNRRKRLPNGFGQISEIKGKNLRKPFRAMVTVGKTEDGRPIVELLQPQAYFESYNAAYAALVEHNKNPYTIEDNITVEELYERWVEYRRDLVSPKTLQSDDLSWKRNNTNIKDIAVRELKAHHIKHWLDTAIAAPSVKIRLKVLLNQMLDFAVEYELVDKNYSKIVSVTKINKEIEENHRGHISFAADEMQKLWANRNNPMAEWLLFQCYTGLRPQESLLVRTENIHLEAGYLVAGMKTKAGTDRIVPIHFAIRPIVEKHYEEAKKKECEYLVNTFGFWKNLPGKILNYRTYTNAFASLMQELEMGEGHRPHDCRKQFITMAKKYNVDEYAIKRIVGHSIKDLTERIYTERPLEWLIDEVQKIKVDEFYV